MIQEDDCSGCNYHRAIGIFGFEWCTCDKNKEVHDEIDKHWCGRIGHKGRRLPRYNEVHHVCPDSTSNQPKEGDLTLDLTENGKGRSKTSYSPTEEE